MPDFTITPPDDFDVKQGYALFSTATVLTLSDPDDTTLLTLSVRFIPSKYRINQDLLFLGTDGTSNFEAMFKQDSGMLAIRGKNNVAQPLAAWEACMRQVRYNNQGRGFNDTTGTQQPVCEG